MLTLPGIMSGCVLMTDYIKRAVELAEGWVITHFYVGEDWEDWVEFYDYSYSGGHPYITFQLQSPIQHDLDALAAQLVRQVDSLRNPRCMVIQFPESVEVALDQSRQGEHISKSIGDDRTMNTIKAIVDSGVLE